MKEATRADRPAIGTVQSQCVLCWKIFSSDAACESHKPYARLPGDPETGRIAEREACTEPSELGLVGRDRGDGVRVWGVTSDEEMELKRQRLEKARASRGRRKK